ncbi:hypothetical protein ACTQZK_05975 [Paraeggerthella sp. LCP19S3_G8]|uniref:hypothetical protein n=1 Tax=Paraeggerthella sp. LCP19S3_G8 TaxID=3440248 RepID=UPI002A8C5E18|nr:hypothetical protein [Paraeggerthella sp.]
MIALPSFDRYSILFHYEIDANEQGEGAKPMACFALFAGERAIDPLLPRPFARLTRSCARPLTRPFSCPARSCARAIDPPLFARPARSREQAIDPPVLLPSTVLRTKNRVRWQVLTV